MGWIQLRQTLATWPCLTSRSCLPQSHKNPEFNLFPWRPFCASHLPLPWHVLPYLVYKSAFFRNGILKTACHCWWYCGMYGCMYVCFVCQLIGCLLGVRVCVCVCVCVWVCKHGQQRVYSDTSQSDRGQHCTRGRSSICGQKIANCLLLHIKVCWKIIIITCTGFGPRFSAEKSYISCAFAILC